MNPMTMHTATVAGQQNNAHYPNRHQVTTVADLEAVARLDHVAAEYQGGRRSSTNFVTSNCLVMDVDNSHTENPDAWVTPESLAGRLPGVLRQVFFLSWEWCRNLGQFLGGYGSEVFDGAAACGGGDVCAF